MKRKHIAILTSIFVICIASLIALVMYVSKDKDQIITALVKELKIKDSTLKQTAGLYSTTSIKRDSLTKVNALLSRYRGLTDAMFYRDSVRGPLKYRRGDIVKLKRDSTWVVIDDIIVGGSQYEYYIKYIVEHKDKTLETLSPEKIFTK